MVIVTEVMTNLKVVKKEIEASTAKNIAHATLKIWNAGKCAKNAWLITSEVKENMKKVKKRKITLDVMTNLSKARKRTTGAVAVTAKIIAIVAAETGSAKKSAINA